MTMSDSHTALQQIPTTNDDDGWNDAAAEEAGRFIRGTIMKFVDWRYYAGKQATPIPDGTKLIALATVALWQRWEGGKAVDPIVRKPGEYLPAREKLGHMDETEWEKGSDGKPQDPWKNTRLVYFVHPVSAAAYTFSTSSGGGRSAVSELGGAIRRMRAAHPNAVPVVELRAEEMPTKHGRKSKPKFLIVDWKFTDTQTVPVERQLTAADDDFGSDDKAIVDRSLDDEIPFYKPY
jgi:hypothetical protein